jgi:hypothetical protein
MPSPGDEPGILRRVEAHELWPGGVPDFLGWLEQRPILLGDALGGRVRLRLDDLLPHGVLTGEATLPERPPASPLVLLAELRSAQPADLAAVVSAAARLEAGVVVWLATALSHELRELIRWLGHSSRVAWFGVELALVAIDDSRPAVGLDVVVAPSGWRSPSSAVADTPLTPEPPRGTILYVGATERSQRGERTIRVGLEIQLGDRRANETALDRLLEERVQIERECGEPRMWERDAATGGGWVGLERSAEARDANAWREQWEGKLKSVLGPRAHEIAAIQSLHSLGERVTTLPGR